MFASIAVEAPARAAEALVALLPGQAVRHASVSGCSVVARDLRILFAPLSQCGRAREVLVLPLATRLSVEQVIETACALGFHAEETAYGTLEFWIDEGFALALTTPEAALGGPALLAA